MKIVVGSDHRGFELKKRIIALLKKDGHAVTDAGTHSPQPCDYPQIAHDVARQVAGGACERGILACKSGIGMSMAANKVRGVRAALCCGQDAAALSRRHNDANVLVLGADDLRDSVDSVVRTWLSEKFEGGRHQRRVDQISRIEKEENLK